MPKKYNFSEKKKVKLFIMERYQAGEDQEQIARALNEAGIKTCTGKEWSRASLSQFAIRCGMRRHRKVTRSSPIKEAPLTPNLETIPVIIDKSESLAIMRLLLDLKIEDASKAKILKVLAASL